MFVWVFENGFAIEEIMKVIQPDEAYFWAVHSGAELDLLLIKNGRRIGIECKRVDAPTLTNSMRTVLELLDLSELVVVYPGKKPYPLSDQVKVIPLSHLAEPQFLN